MIGLTQKLSLKEQTEILNESFNKDIHLSKILSEKGLSYDNLRYINYTNGYKLQEKNYNIEQLKEYGSNIPAISFFSGAGGMDLGFEYAGFNTLASVENTEFFCNTLRYNSKERIVIGPPFYDGDISNKEKIALQLKSLIGLKENFEGVFHGGPPCQPFSVASNQRFKKGDENFKRLGFENLEKGNLLFDFIWLIKHFKPKAFVIENVPGLLKLDNGNQLNAAIRELQKAGYKVPKPTILNATYFGVPQNRNRLFIVGTLSTKKFQYPISSIFQTPCIDVFNSELESTENHETRKHTARSVFRYMKLDYGGRDQLGRVDRLNPFLPSKTIIAGGNKGGGRSHLHPFSPRTLSVRESAKIQTFPDDYIFTGSTARQFTQVGNSVPVKLAFKIAKELKNII
jgi:DNA (cytosine-5)-methyltransferase 1